MDASKVRGNGAVRYMQGDLCERPERNSRPNSWDNDDSTDDGIIPGLDPNINPKTPSNDDGAGESTIYDSSSYSDNTILDTDVDKTDGNIFAKIFGFLGFKGDSFGCDTSTSSTYNSQVSSPQLSAEGVITLKKHY